MSNSALQVARTGLDAQSERMRVIANNLANVNTTGFQRDRAEFATLAYQMVTAAGATSSGDNHYSTGLNLGTGVRITGTGRVTTQGALSTTSQPARSRDRGRRLFPGRAARRHDGLYPRRQFPHVLGRQDRHLGRPADPARNPDPGRRPVDHDRHRRHRFGDAAGPDRGVGSRPHRNLPLRQRGGPAGARLNIYGETAASGAAQTGPAGAEGRGSIRQGALEGSNVNVVQELVDMIETQRAYEVNSKMIQATDEMLRNANQQL